jgi:hypothetical protein
MMVYNVTVKAIDTESPDASEAKYGHEILDMRFQHSGLFTMFSVVLQNGHVIEAKQGEAAREQPE